MDKVSKNLIRKSGEGFTLIEILIVITILIIMTVMAVPYFYSFQKKADLDSSAEKIISIIRIAQNKTRASEQGSQWGVRFENNSDPNPDKYILFKGSSYISADETYSLSGNIEIYDISLAGGGSGIDIIFNKLSGGTSQDGSISIRLKNDITKTRKISVQPSGQVSISEENAPIDTRIKGTDTDSRHVHFDYSGPIDTAEKLILVFNYDGLQEVKELLISEILTADQKIYWDGDVYTQKLKIHTHNDIISGTTQFCIHRDQRYNTKNLQIKYSGDSGQYLIQYDINGDAAEDSIFIIDDPVWQ